MIAVEDRRVRLEGGPVHHFGPPFHHHLPLRPPPPPRRRRGRERIFSWLHPDTWLNIAAYCFLFAVICLLVLFVGRKSRRLLGRGGLPDSILSQVYQEYSYGPKCEVSELILAIENVEDIGKYFSSVKADIQDPLSNYFDSDEDKLDRKRKRTIFYREDHIVSSRRGKKKKKDPTLEVYYEHSIAFYLSRMKEDSSPQARKLLNQMLLAHFWGQANEHIRPRYHPLTSAYRQQRYNVAFTLVQAGKDHPGRISLPNNRSEFRTIISTIPEVYASYLDCSDIRHVDPRVTLVTFMGERRQCVLEYPHTTPFASSQLYHYLEARGMNPDPFEKFPSTLPVVRDMPRHVISNMPSSAFSENPFQRPPIGVLPDYRRPIIHPGCFENFFSAISFYLFGSLKDFFLSQTFLHWSFWILFAAGLFSAVMECMDTFFVPLYAGALKLEQKFFSLVESSGNHSPNPGTMVDVNSAEEGTDRIADRAT